MLFRAGRQAGLPLDHECTELVAINLGEDDEDVCKATVGNQHLLAIEDVVRAVLTQPRCRFRGHRVGTRTRFRERVGRDQFAGSYLRQILLFGRVSAEVNDRQQPMPLSAPSVVANEAERPMFSPMSAPLV